MELLKSVANQETNWLRPISLLFVFKQLVIIKFLELVELIPNQLGLTLDLLNQYLLNQCSNLLALWKEFLKIEPSRKTVQISTEDDFIYKMSTPDELIIENFPEPRVEYQGTEVS